MIIWICYSFYRLPVGKAILKFFLLVCFAGAPFFIAAQKPPPKKELDKAKQMQAEGLKQMEEQLKELEKTDPKNAKMIREMMKQGMSEDSEVEENSGLTTKAPVKQTTRLAAIPSRLLSKTELVEWSKKSYASLLSKLTSQEKERFDKALALCGESAKNLEDASILNWLKKSPKGALLFAMKATIISPDEVLFWNNLAAMLNLTGNEHKAVPLLRYLQQSFPTNSIILNNLGQAYLGLGDLTTAKKFLDSSLKYNPYHPEANHSMGLIYRFMGNTIKSNYHFEKETRVCVKKPVVEELKKSKSQEELYNIVKAKFLKPKNYFTLLGLNNFVVPKLPASVDESNQLYQAHIDFRKNVQDEIKKWGTLDMNLSMNPPPISSQQSIYSYLLETVLLPHLEKEKEKKIGWMQQEDVTNITYPTPGSIASRLGQQRTKKYLEDESRLYDAHRYEDSVNEVKKNAELKANPANWEYISHKWEQIRIETALKYCRRKIKLADAFLRENAGSQPMGFADRTKTIIELLNEAMSYTELAPNDVSVALQAHNLIVIYLTYLDAYSSATVIASTKANGYKGFALSINCDMDELLAQKYELAQTTFVDAECAFKIVIPLIVAKLSFNCQKVEMEGGEILIVNAEYEFKTGNTTLAIGPGASVDIPFIGVGAKNQAFVTFDRNGNYSDAGFKGEVGVELSGYLQSVGQEIENIGLGPTLETKAGYEFSINSGASAKTEIAGKETPIVF